MTWATFAPVISEVREERKFQDARWGEQNHPNGTGKPGSGVGLARARMACKVGEELKTLTWLHILEEEFWEAAAESDPAKLRAELIQVAAVACAWVQAIDRAKRAEQLDGV